MHFYFMANMDNHYVHEDEEGGPNKRVGTLDAFSEALIKRRLQIANWKFQLEELKKTRVLWRSALVSVAEREDTPVLVATNRKRANAVTSAVHKSKFPEMKNYHAGLLDVEQQIAAYEQHIREAETEERGEEQKLIRQGAVLKPDGAVNWPKTNVSAVMYLKEDTRNELKLTIQDGKLYRKVPPPPNIKAPSQYVLFDTARAGTAFTGASMAIYVMDMEGDFYVHSHKVGEFHHSSFFAGKPVACAGEMKVSHGVLKRISNKSGHYKPTAAHFLQALERLRKAKVPDTYEVDFGALDPTVLPAIGLYPNREAFVDAAAPFWLKIEWVKLAAYWEHLQDGPFMQGYGLRWAMPGEPDGVYSIQTGDKYNPRTIRKWLKGLGRKPKPFSDSTRLTGLSFRMAP